MQLNAIAIHEAGHCFVALRKGITIQEVSIDATSGKTIIKQLAIDENTTVIQRRVDKLISLGLSPNEAEQAARELNKWESNKGYIFSNEIIGNERITRAMVDMMLDDEEFRASTSFLLDQPFHYTGAKANMISVCLGGWVAEEVFFLTEQPLSKYDNIFIDPNYNSEKRLSKQLSKYNPFYTDPNYTPMVLRAEEDIRDICDIAGFSEYRDILAPAIVRSQPGSPFLENMYGKYSGTYIPSDVVIDSLVDAVLKEKAIVKSIYFSNRRQKSLVKKLANQLNKKNSLSGAEVAEILGETKQH